MKHTSTTRFTPIRRFIATFVLMATVIFLALQPVAQVVADRFDDQINALQQEISGYQSQQAQLSAQANTLQVAVAQLNSQKAAIQVQVNLSQTKYDQLTQAIADNEAKLKRQQTLLGGTLAQLYVDSQTSSVELLASSTSIADYVEKQEYRSQIRNQALATIKDVKALKAQLAKQQTEVKQVLADQTKQRDDLAAKEAEQANLLAETQGQEAAYQGLVASKNSQVSDLRAQQRAANARIGGAGVVPGDPNRGGYPDVWYNAPQDSIVDSWGLYNRECVSLTAWKVHSWGKYMPYMGGRGNANQWPGAAQAEGIPTGSTPRVHSIAISMAGFYGHAMAVEAVNDDGSIYVSQMNYDLAGHYSEMTVPASKASQLIYIYF